MPNFLKISRQMKKFFIQELGFNRSVFRQLYPIEARYRQFRQLLVEQKTWAKFQIDNSRIEGLARVYTDRRTWLNRLNSSR